MTLAFTCSQLDTDLEVFQLLSGQKGCHYLGGDKGGWRSGQTMTKCEKGERGLKIGVGPVTHFLNGIYTYHVQRYDFCVFGTS